MPKPPPKRMTRTTIKSTTPSVLRPAKRNSRLVFSFMVLHSPFEGEFARLFLESSCFPSVLAENTRNRRRGKDCICHLKSAACRGWSTTSPARRANRKNPPISERHATPTSPREDNAAAARQGAPIVGSRSSLIVLFLKHGFQLVPQLGGIFVPMRGNRMLRRLIEYFLFRARNFQYAVLLARVIPAIDRFSHNRISS